MLVIGIATGNPDHLTMEAVAALNRVDVFFIFDKGDEASALRRVREDICRRFITDHAYRTVAITDPPRDRQAPDYTGAVQSWHRRRADLLASALAAELPDGGCAGLLVWGDPAFYDSTLRILDLVVLADDRPLSYRVIAGISSLQLLASRHRISLHGVGEAFQVTPGRRLAEAVSSGVSNIVVMLDGNLECAAYVDQGFWIYWSAYLGSADELLASGPLEAVLKDIGRMRAAAKKRHGWIMDIYLLRRQAG